MNLINKYNNKGYTLIEIMIVVAVFALLMAATFVIYQRIENKYKAESVSKQLTVLKSNINESFKTTLSPTDLTNTFAISSNFVPQSLVLDANNISNGYGGKLDVGIDGNNYTITLRDVPNYACGYLSATSFIRLAPKITINSMIIKTSGPINSTHVTDMSVSCAINEKATLEASYPISNLPLPNQGISDSGRNKELPKNIAKISGGESALTCNGGAVWVENFCSCPVGTEWDGQECVTFGDLSKKVGWCILGEGVNPVSGQCELLPNQNTTVLPSEQSYKYQNGKYTTSASTTNRINNIQKSFENPIERQNEKIIVGNKEFNYKSGHFDNNTLQVCVNGNWDTQTKSCVTP